MKRVNLHPVLFALYAVLFGYARNFEFAPPPTVLLLLLAIAAGSAAVVWASFAVVMRSAQKSAIAASTLLVLFVSYGHVKNLVTAWSWGFHVFSLQVGAVKITGAVGLAVACAVAIWLHRASRTATSMVATAMNRTATILILVSVVRLLDVGLIAKHQSGVADGAELIPSADHRLSTGAQDLPDVYYIILDGYGRSDVLKAVYNYDNSAFVAWLRQKGFYVADESHSNYSQTMLSLASSLNMMYLDPAVMKAAAPGPGDRQLLATMIQENRVVHTLRDEGYRFVAFTTGYSGVQFPRADEVRRFSLLTDFEGSLLSTTPIVDLVETAYPQRALHRQRVNYVFDHLADSYRGTGPRFVFAHIVSPHPPFIFKPDGTAVSRGTLTSDFFAAEQIEAGNPADWEQLTVGYREQAEYVTRRIEGVLDAILAGSTRRPIIILQGDHGPDARLTWSGESAEAMTERMSILNAYYAPPETLARLYPSITPVNTFRIIMGAMFDSPVNLLPDNSYFAPYASPYDFVDVGETMVDASRLARN